MTDLTGFEHISRAQYPANKLQAEYETLETFRVQLDQ